MPWLKEFARQYPQDAWQVRMRQMDPKSRQPPRTPLDAPLCLLQLTLQGVDVRATQRAKTPGSKVLHILREIPNVMTPADQYYCELLRQQPPPLGLYEAHQKLLTTVANISGASLPLSQVPPVILGVLVGSLPSVQQLVQTGADINATDRLGNTALHWATLTQQTAMTQWLIQAGADETRLNFLQGTPNDYAHPPVSPHPWRITLHAQGTTDKHTIHQKLGFHVLEHSTLSPDVIFAWAQSALQPDQWAPISELLPLEDLPAGVPAALTLRHFDDLGWGLCATEALQASTFVGSYTGELISGIEASLRRQQHGSLKYILRAFEFPSSKANYLTWWIDAEQAGGLLSRANSSHSPGYANMTPRGGVRHGRPVVDLYTNMDVPAGKQLVWYYGEDFWKNTKPLSLTDKEHAFYWPPHMPPHAPLKTTSSVDKLLRSNKYKLTMIDLSAAKSAITLLGTQQRQGKLSLAFEAAQRAGKSPLLWLLKLHAAPGDVQDCVMQLMDTQKATNKAAKKAAKSAGFHDVYRQRFMPKQHARLIFDDLQPERLPSNVRAALQQHPSTLPARRR